MNIKISTILAIVTVMMSMNSLAVETNTKSCDYGFPHHFEIIGPENTHIISLEELGHEWFNVSVTNKTDTSFDVVQDNEKKCRGGAVSLTVGTDAYHYAEYVLVDGEKNITKISSREMNRFGMKEIIQNIPNYQIIFEQIN